MYDLAGVDLIICMTWLGGFNYMYDLAGEDLIICMT